MARVQDVRDLLFPVEERPVFVSVKSHNGERHIPVPDKKAIVNQSTGGVLGIVGHDYPVVTNEQALAWARLCCNATFPDATESEWQVHAVDAPSTASYCHIDLVHNSGAVDFAFVPAKARPEVFGPFVRVTNSYNSLRALTFDIGFHRKVCKNGLILPQSIIKLRFPHDRRQLRAIRFDVDAAQVNRLTHSFKESVSSLVNCPVAEELFLPFTCGVLGIRPPDADNDVLTKEKSDAWRTLCESITGLTRKYVSELGSNAYAVLNTITDFASQPPENPWVRRDRHTLQRLAGKWLAQFASECKQKPFDVTFSVSLLN
jgi:hypothetical protein